MRILAIGDPHGNVAKLRKIPKKGVDLILLTGDLGNADLARKIAFENVERRKKGLPEIKETPEIEKKMRDEIFYSSISVLNYCRKFAPVYFISGNIEPFGGERPTKKTKNHWIPYAVRKMKNVKIINNRVVNFNGVRIGGVEYFIDVNWVREFKPSNYKEKIKLARKQTEKIRKVLKWFGEVDVLVHHQPPYRILDKVGPLAPKHWRGKNAGSETILKYIEKFQPKYSFCGHIHEGEGTKKVGKSEVYNLGVCGYKIVELD